jgi:hypothetical protein
MEFVKKPLTPGKLRVELRKTLAFIPSGINLLLKQITNNNWKEHKKEIRMMMKSKNDERNESHLFVFRQLLRIKKAKCNRFSCLCYPLSGLFPLIL